MISDRDIDRAAAEFGLRPQDVEKDYVHGWLLHGIFARPALADTLVLKGGNALRKAYLPATRFSKDLDFSALRILEQHLLEAELREVCALVERQTGVRFLEQMVVKDKKLPIPGVEAVEARVYFKGFYAEENLTLKAQLDVTQFDKPYLAIQSRPLLHPYPDDGACATTIRCQKLEEILASKLTALLHRRHVADLFDLLYAILISNDYPVNRLEVVRTFLKKSVYEPRPAEAKQQLLSVPLEACRSLWPTIVAPARSLFRFDDVVARFAGLIESLFALLTGAPVTAPTGGFARRAVLAPSVFAPDDRSIIVEAGRARNLVELLYDNSQRLVEPYKLEYAVRKQDGRGLEYFWGYDTTGGKTGPGIKRFICDKIQAVRPTQRPFTPRYEVAL